MEQLREGITPSSNKTQLPNSDNYIQVLFEDINTLVPQAPGLYEIYTQDGIALKVGISINLRKRLGQHFASRQNALKLREGGRWENPQDVISKSSILAKHLYFWTPALMRGYDLKAEAGRNRFLAEQCVIRFRVTQTRAEARALEKVLEQDGSFRFVGELQSRY